MTTSRIECTYDATLPQRIQSEVFGSADVPKDLEDLKALRDAVAKLPLSGA